MDKKTLIHLYLLNTLLQNLAHCEYWLSYASQRILLKRKIDLRPGSIADLCGQQQLEEKVIEPSIRSNERESKRDYVWHLWREKLAVKCAQKQ